MPSRGEDFDPVMQASESAKDDTATIRQSEFVISPPTNPSIQSSINPSDSAEAPDPYDEAYNSWFRINCGAEPFDPEKLQRLYDAIPPEEI